jgi:hypothetical protein
MICTLVRFTSNGFPLSPIAFKSDYRLPLDSLWSHISCSINHNHVYASLVCVANADTLLPLICLSMQTKLHLALLLLCLWGDYLVSMATHSFPPALKEPLSLWYKAPLFRVRPKANSICTGLDISHPALNTSTSSRMRPHWLCSQMVRSRSRCTASSKL